jgi:hypothetical protein
VKIKSSESYSEIIILRKQLEEHQTESNKFYKIQNEIKSLVKVDNSVCAISMDFEKNLPLPLT